MKNLRNTQNTSAKKGNERNINLYNIPWPSLWLCPSLSGLIRPCKGLVRLHKPYKALKNLRRPYKGFVRPYLEGFTTLSLRLFKEPRPRGPHSRRNGMASKHMGPRGHSDPLSMRKKAQTARPQDPCDCTLNPNYEDHPPRMSLNISHRNPCS